MKRNKASSTTSYSHLAPNHKLYLQYLNAKKYIEKNQQQEDEKERGHDDNPHCSTSTCVLCNNDDHNSLCSFFTQSNLSEAELNRIFQCNTRNEEEPRPQDYRPCHPPPPQDDICVHHQLNLHQEQQHQPYHFQNRDNHHNSDEEPATTSSINNVSIEDNIEMTDDMDIEESGVEEEQVSSDSEESQHCKYKIL